MSTRTHICVFFDDGEIEHFCGCGERALYLVDDEEVGGVLVLLQDDTATVTTLVPARRARELAVSA
ncbi:MAG: hypothetical protein JWP95_2039 [Actinotalea sp.]|jgi:hypothetical protein|nr:hypothetical protein [Actinotalea sp.]